MVTRPAPAYEGDAPYLFVCYAHKDLEVVFPEMLWLQQAKFNLWYDDAIQVGSIWRSALADAVAESAALVFYATKQSVASENCLKEIDFALDDHKPIFVVQLDDATLPRHLRLSLGDRQALIRSEFETGVYKNRLTEALRKVCGDSGQEKSPKIRSSRPATHGTYSGSDNTCIAVFPFANFDADDNTEYFSDGLTDELINALAQVEGLQVVSRTSVFGFKDKPTDIRSFGEQLNADAVVEGSVRSDGTKIRVSAQLTDVADGLNIWSSKYDRELVDIFSIQDDITHAIVDSLEVNLGRRRKRHRPLGSTTMEAYDLFLQGKYMWYQQTEEGLNAALEAFIAATKLDPELAVAHAGIADVYSSLGFHGFLPTQEALPEARVAAEKSLDIDSSQPDANISMAFVRIFLDRNWEDAEHYLRRAVELNPSSSRAYYYLTAILQQQGRHRMGRAAIGKAIELDPMNPMILAGAGWAEYYAGRPEEAIKKLTDAVEIEPTYPEFQIALAAAYEQLGDAENALRCAQIAADTYGEDPLVLAFLGCIYGATGNEEKALSILSKMDEVAQSRYVPQACYALVYMGLKDAENAIARLEKAVADKDALLSWMHVLPVAQWLRKDPRFLDILRQIGFRISESG